MKNLFDPAVVSEIHTRIDSLTPGNPRRWGKMEIAQAVAHCASSVEWVVRDSFPPRIFIGRIIGGFIKPMMLKDDQPIRPNSPTVKSLIVTGDRDLSAEKERLSKLIDRFVAGGQANCTTHPHPFFGRLTPDEWAIVMYKHIDHHLRQFDA
jgi:Protein of unknown function (DUF1569)